ncbi:MOSC domain-containing protein [Aeromicrobium sp. CTD01-1L150]|uniref:MOSC domain-containing protein n=1 Tax=Aeromicrobium sp. CTD01-1L150 TaxID=3341830 RepID=UPI0035C1D012
MAATVESVNIGTTRDVPWGSLKRSAIDKRPTSGPVRVRTLGVEGDEIADLEHHGGRDQAVYVYAAEDLAAWAKLLGRDLRPGQFGENLTTRGLDVQGARIGERWRIGSVVLEVSDVRIPCSVFQGFLGEPRWVRRFAEHGVPGAYLRVVEEGTLSAGDPVVVVERRDHDLTVGLTFRALTTRRELLASLAAEPRASAKIQGKIAALPKH